MEALVGLAGRVEGVGSEGDELGLGGGGARVAGARPAGSLTPFQVAGVGGISATGVSAVLVDVTVVAASPTFLTLLPEGAPRPPLSTVNATANQINGTVGENRQDVKAVVENPRKLSTDLQTTTENLNAITGQVKSGEGTIGKLVYSEEAHQRLNKALESVEGGVTELKNTL